MSWQLLGLLTVDEFLTVSKFQSTGLTLPKLPPLRVQAGCRHATCSP